MVLFPFTLASTQEDPAALQALRRSRRTVFLAGVVERFKETERLEADWLSKVSEPDLERTLETRSSRLGIDVSVRQALLQICMHTQGHRSQCATRLRALGGTPPGMDYVLWIREQNS